MYRTLATFILLVAGFNAFPERRTLFALCVIVFNLGVSCVVEYLTMLQAVDNQLMDAGERKTRFTTLVAAERVAAGRDFEQWSFWDEVNRRVAEERSIQDQKETPPRWYVATALTIWNVVSRLMGDLIAIALALLFTGGTS